MIKLLHLQLLILLAVYANGQKARKNWQQKSQELEGDGTFGLCENEAGAWYYFRDYEGQESACQKEVAKVKYSNQINETGWAFVEVEIAQRMIPPYKQGYAAGFVEGRATRDLIRLHLSNTVDGFCDGAAHFCEDLNEYLLSNYLWMMDNIASYPEDRYWLQVNMTLNQLMGMIDGYEGKLGQNLGIEQIVTHPIYLIQLAGDIEDLAVKFGKPETQRSQLTGTGHCSALVKLLPDMSDIYFSHVTWASYSSMLRMQKRYTFALGEPGRSYAFSSYPASISSVDDFIVTSARLAILETTISNYNERLLRFMTPSSVLCWVRTQWAKIFSKFNSGTYNNQWSILDYKMFRKGREDHPSHGLLHVLEQLPYFPYLAADIRHVFRNHTAHADMTHVLLRNFYWPSYNTPQIFKWSDGDKMVKKFGDWYSYDRTPRARIFRRDHGSVVDMDSMIKLMRCDCNPPYSAENAISCRSDLNPENGTYPFPSLGYRDHGATDMKVTNSRLIETLSFTAIAGPTHDPTPVFDWTTTPFESIVPHNGQPTRWT
ncbi:unnamed protein product [Nippostrongylus brasiliensis]|uniref:Phospholipase B-like n=1 Tax=Nippostrongylus brasiliensis TaxID=27835 RepID=A0A0N4YTA9_NIPBR|nr:unnamed protein product [Nippostrongylus brasiliensis]